MVLTGVGYSWLREGNAAENSTGSEGNKARSRVRQTLGLFAGGVFGVALGQLGFLLVAQVEVETVAERQGAAGWHRVVALVRVVRELLFVVVPAEGIRAEQPVIARHPPGGMPQVLRMIEDRHAVGLAV